LAEETEVRPKPMVEIGGMPILWHITMHYHRYGYHEFAIPLGYKGEYIDGDDVMFEHAPMRRLAADGEPMAFRHESFWQCMDILREKHVLQQLWDSGQAPWLKAGVNQL
jgi:NDP-sugar pyrophosphorylase family protein